MTQPALTTQIELPEQRFEEQLTFLEVYGKGARPPVWKLTPATVVSFICGAEGLRLDSRADIPPDVPARMDIP